MTDNTFQRVGIVGSGAIGRGVAEFLAAAGLEVTTVHPESEGVLDLGDLASADLVIEAVKEDADVKRSVLERIAAAVSDATVIVSATSALSITQLATSVPRPERFAGLIWHLPVATTRTVEVAPGILTDGAVVDRLVAWVDGLDPKQAVVIADRPGFLLNSLLMPYLNDVVQAYDEGLATAADLDLALELGLGYKVGPLAVLDRIGLDVHRDATRVAHHATGDPRFAVPPVLERMVAAGRLGDKTGSGFHSTKED
jgi:3-hydroxybutyryl-CoA dehydrogenase